VAKEREGTSGGESEGDSGVKVGGKLETKQEKKWSKEILDTECNESRDCCCCRGNEWRKQGRKQGEWAPETFSSCSLPLLSF